MTSDSLYSLYFKVIENQSCVIFLGRNMIWLFWSDHIPYTCCFCLDLINANIAPKKPPARVRGRRNPTIMDKLTDSTISLLSKQNSSMFSKKSFLYHHLSAGASGTIVRLAKDSFQCLEAGVKRWRRERAIMSAARRSVHASPVISLQNPECSHKPDLPRARQSPSRWNHWCFQ